MRLYIGIVSSCVNGVFMFITIFSALFLSHQSLWAQSCTPSSATLCVAGDDNTYVWINGNEIVTNQPSAGGFLFPYVNWTDPGSPLCVSVPLGDLSGTNVISAVTYNTACCDVWTSWALDISCSNTSNHTVITSSNTPDTFYFDAGGGNPPPMNGGLNWWQPAYSAPGTYFTSPSFNLGGHFWGKQIYDPSNT